MDSTTRLYYPVYSWPFWKSYFIQMRPYLLFVSGVAGASGIAMSKTADVPDWKCWIAFVLFFLGYGFGQALTDCFQTDTDKLSAPYRPLSKNEISVKSVLLVSLTGLLLSGVLFFLLNPISFGLSLLAVAGLATYSWVKKHVWFGGPFYNAWIVALLPLMGYFSNSPAEAPDLPEMIPYLLITFFSYSNFVLIGYLKDITADTATGYKTFPVVFGWNKTVAAGDIIAIITLLIFWWNTKPHLPELIFGLAGSVNIIIGLITARLSKLKNETDALIPILSTVRSFILLHIAIVLNFQPSWNWYAIVYYLLFEWALANRPSKYQV